MYIFSKLNKNYYCYYYYNHNYNKILKFDWLSTALISALIGQCPSRLSNWTVHAIRRVLKWLFFTAGKKGGLRKFCALILKKRAYISQISS